MFFKAINFLDHSYSRNIIFAFLMGFFGILFGSLSTALLLASSVFVIFINPRISIKELWLECKVLTKKIPILFVFPAFYFFVVLTSFRSEDWFFDVIAIAGSYWQFLVLVPASVGIFHLSKDANFAGLFSYGCRFGLLFVVPLSLLQIYFFDMRPEGVYGNSLVFASLCIVGAGLSIIQWPEDTQSRRLVSLITFCVGLIAALLVFAKSMLLPIAVVLIIAAFYYLATKYKGKVLVKVSLMLCFLIGAFLVTSVYSNKGWSIIETEIVQPLEKYTSGQKIEHSITKRFDMQLTGFNAFMNNPFLGSGIQNVMDEANSLSQEVLGRKTEYTNTHLHNDYLTHAVGGGVILFALFLGVLISPLFIAWSVYSRKKETALFFFALILVGAYSTIAITNVIFRNDQLATMFCVATIFIIIRHLQILHGHEQVRIPDFSIIANGINPLGLDTKNKAKIRRYY